MSPSSVTFPVFQELSSTSEIKGLRSLNFERRKMFKSSSRARAIQKASNEATVIGNVQVKMDGLSFKSKCALTITQVFLTRILSVMKRLGWSISMSFLPDKPSRCLLLIMMMPRVMLIMDSQSRAQLPTVSTMVASAVVSTLVHPLVMLTTPNSASKTCSIKHGTPKVHTTTEIMLFRWPRMLAKVPVFANFTSTPQLTLEIIVPFTYTPVAARLKQSTRFLLTHYV